MCFVRAAIEYGLIDSERVARIQTVDGVEEVIVSRRQVQGGRLLAFKIHDTGKKVLIELPRESTSGRWRVWVARKMVEKS